jgi:ABC-type nitrate/sulfonate/bicarbonate transport system permease component
MWGMLAHCGRRSGRLAKMNKGGLTPLSKRKPSTLRSVPQWVWRLLSILVFLGLWELFGRNVNPVLLASPTSIAVAFVGMIQTGELLQALGQSAQPFLLGLALALVVGIALGVLIGRVQVMDVVFKQLLDAIHVVPPVALIPMVMMWFGLGLKAKVFIVFLMAVFPVLYNTLDGTRAISRQHVEVARAHGATEWQVFLDVTIYAALPFIMSGFRQGTGRALIGLIVAELFTSLSGLGAMIAVFSNTLETAKMFVVVILLGLFGMLFMSFGSWLEQRVAPWKKGERAW